MKTLWQPLRQVRRQQVPAGLRAWLFDQHSLTQRLRERFGRTFRVQLGSQTLGYALPDECRQLRMREGSYALIRQVYLEGQGQAVVYARTIIPVTSLRGSLRRLRTLGNRPLGEFLFTRLSAVRAGVELAAIPPGHHLHELICKQTEVTQETLWARRSLFYIGHRPLLVLELFLPSLYLDAGKNDG